MPRPSPVNPGTPQHYPALDGLRGLAILLVLANHLFLTNDHPNSRLVTLLTGIRLTTWVGVDLFLALSGFLITGILLRTRSLPHFYARRALRILPVYWLALAVLSTFHMQWNGFAWPLLTFTQNTPFWFTRAVPQPLEGYTAHLWTISLEEQFYLAWPALVLLLPSRRSLRWTALTLAATALTLRCILVAHGIGAQYTYKLLPCRMDTFLLGAWLAVALAGKPTRRPLPKPRILFAASTLVLLLFALHEHGLDWRTSRFTNSAGYTLIAVACTSLIAMALQPNSLTARALANTWLRALGRYSYGIYIWHMILGALPIPPIRATLAARHIGPGPQFLAGALTATALSIALGALSYHAFEIHFLRLKRYFPVAAPVSVHRNPISSA